MLVEVEQHKNNIFSNMSVKNELGSESMNRVKMSKYKIKKKWKTKIVVLKSGELLGE